MKYAQTPAQNGAQTPHKMVHKPRTIPAQTRTTNTPPPTGEGLHLSLALPEGDLASKFIIEGRMTMTHEDTDYRIMAAADWAETIPADVDIMMHPQFTVYFGSFSQSEFVAALDEIERRGRNKVHGQPAA